MITLFTNRDVAVNVLPKDFVADPNRLRRFEQEAKTLAALNHPNILTLHDAGVHEGAPYLVSELFEGRTLRELLGIMATTALPVRSADAYIRAKGTPGGEIADVGIRAPDVEASTVALSVVESTEPGMVLGTPAYINGESIIKPFTPNRESP